MTLPNWLVPQTDVSHMELTYENFFVTVIQRVTAGEPISRVIREDPRDIPVGEYLRWIHKDSQRKQAYYEARSIGAALVEDELTRIADAIDDPLEDVQRSTLRINTRKWLLGVWDRKRYGDIKQIEVNQQISITAALEEAHSRVTHGVTYEQEDQFPDRQYQRYVPAGVATDQTALSEECQDQPG